MAIDELTAAPLHVEPRISALAAGSRNTRSEAKSGSERTVGKTGRPSQSEKKAGRRSVAKPVINFWLDLVLAVVFVVLCSVSAVLQFAFPAASLAAGWTLWGLTYDDVAAIQFGTLCVLAAGIILHVMLHWSWVCGMLTRGNPDASLRTDDGIRTIVGVGVLIALLHVIGGVLLAALLTIQQP
ncbi:DUF4405 domain-containing protein [bacterium]|nr:DUF4405 domain-containing protein [bacterium]